MDDFYSSPRNNSRTSSELLSRIWELARSAPNGLLFTLLLAPLLIIIGTRISSGTTFKRSSSSGAKKPPIPPYWFPAVGHSLSFLSDPLTFMINIRDQSLDGIFALNMGAQTINVVSNPHIVTELMTQKESTLSSTPFAWAVVCKFFGFPQSAKEKYIGIWEDLTSCFGLLMRDPSLSNMMNRISRGLERNIPQMITFIDSEIDQQPWERFANTTYISETEAETNLMSIVRDMLGYVSVPAVFGSALLEKYPNTLQNIYTLDYGMNYFLMGLPAWFPWPGVLRAHLARQKLWQCLDDQQRALDAMVDGKHVDSSWGDLEDDVSEMILKRHKIFKDNNFEIKARGDLSVLWALVVNANMLVYWQILHILRVPGLRDRIRAEIAPYATIEKGATIGKISEAPQLKLQPESLAKKCPLLKSTYLETLRLADQPWSVRAVTKDVVVSGDKRAANPSSYILHKGEYLTVPHDLHMRDPAYFSEPEKFDAERFLVKNEDGTLSTEMGTIRPYGGGPSMCKGRVFAERECLALVAGVLSYWDIEPADKKAGWVIPKQQKTSAVSRPVSDTRVRIKRRRFEWDA